MKLKLTGVLALLLAVSCGLTSCSLFGGKKKHATRRSEPTFVPRDSPVLGSDGPNLGSSQERR